MSLLTHEKIDAQERLLNPTTTFYLISNAYNCSSLNNDILIAEDQANQDDEFYYFGYNFDTNITIQDGAF